jgi:hypothetical protein
MGYGPGPERPPDRPPQDEAPMALVTIRGISGDERARPAVGFRPFVERLEDRTVPSTLESRVPPPITGVDPNTGVNASIDILGASENGQYIIFQSQATNLVDKQISPPLQTNIFWRNVATNETKLVSRYGNDPSFGIPANFFKSLGAVQSVVNPGPDQKVSYNAVISEDGSKVAFLSTANAYFFDPSLRNANPAFDKLAADGGGADVFLWDSGITGGNPDTTTLVTRNYKGQALGQFGTVTSPSISYYGETVSFVSSAQIDNVIQQKVVGGYPNKGTIAGQFVGLIDPLTFAPLPGTVTLGNPTDFPIRDDGQNGPDIFRAVVGQVPEPVSMSVVNVTFLMLEVINNFLVFNIRNWDRMVMDGDIQVDPLNRYATLGETEWVAIRTSKNEAYRYSYFPPTAAPPIVIGQSGSPAYESIGGTSPGETGAGVVDNAIISRVSGDIFFTYKAVTAAGNLVKGYVNNNGGGFDLYRVTLSTGGSGGRLVELVSAAAGTSNQGANGPLDLDPRAYQITGDGTKALFTSKATNLVTGISDTSPASKSGGTFDVFQRNLENATTTIISVTEANPTQAGNGDSRFPTQTPDSLVIGFESTATNLTEIPDINGTATDVFVRDLAPQGDPTRPDTLLASSLTGNTQTGNARSYNLVVVRTSQIDETFFRNFLAFFVSDATNLDPNAPTLPAPGQMYREQFPIFISKLSRIVAYSGGVNGFVAIATTDKLGRLTEVNRFQPFPGYSGEIRVATGDINGDGSPDVVVGGGPGAGPRVKIVDGFTLRSLDDFFAFESTFTGGVYVGAADMNADGRDDVIIGAGEGGGPRVQIYDSDTGLLIFDDFAYEPVSRTGVRVAAGDFNGDGKIDLFLAAGVGGGPRVRVFNGAALPGVNVLADFFAFESAQRGGAYITAGDFNGDGLADIGVGGGPGGGPRVSVFNAANVSLLDPNTPLKFVDFFAFPPGTTEGARPVIRNINGSKAGGLIVGTGSGFPRIRTFTGNNPVDGGALLQAQEIVPFDELVGRFGAWVG